MLNLEDRLKKASEEPQPYGPPADGFSNLQRELGRAPTTPAPWTGYLVIMMIVVASALAYRLTTHVATQHPIPEWTLPVVPDSGGGAFPVSEPVPQTIRAPTFQAVAVRRPVASLPPDRSSPATSLARYPTQAVPEDLPATNGPVDPPAPVPSNTFGAIYPLLPPTVPVPTSLQRRSTPSWDIRLNFYPNPGKQYRYFRSYTEERPVVGTDYSSTEFVVDGKLRLFYEVAEASEAGRRLMPVMQFQVHRRTARGIGFGLGTTYFRSDYLQENSAKDWLGEGSARYAAFSEERFRLWLVSVNVGYEFPTSGRWKPWVHAGVQLGLRSVRREEDRLISGSRDEGWTQNSSREVKYPLITGQDWAIPNLEAGVLYRLSGHWLAGLSVGAAPGDYADIQPTLGAEVRYRW